MTYTLSTEQFNAVADKFANLESTCGDTMEIDIEGGVLFISYFFEVDGYTEDDTHSYIETRRNGGITEAWVSGDDEVDYDLSESDIESLERIIGGC